MPRKKPVRVDVRCSPEIKHAIKMRALNLNTTISELAVESFLTQQYYILDLNPEIAEFNKTFSAIGRNLNQMVRAMNTINAKSRSVYDINLYVDNPEFGQIAEQLEVLVDEFQAVSKQFAECEQKLSEVYKTRLLHSDLENLFSDDPDLLETLRSR